MFVRANVLLQDANGRLREPGVVFDMPDDAGPSPAYQVLTKAQAKKLGLTGDVDPDDLPPLEVPES